MSILVKPYKISVWEDQWENSVLQEKCIATIGSNEMTYQGRALEPTLVRNVNGQKKLSFKMYKYFIDNETGEKVENVFSDLLVNERKVKLYYEDSWFDFVVKDINESSSNYLFTYSLEDAIVQELSKNGFGVTFDKDLMNNLGDIKTLATEALKETDWVVDAEEFVEKVDEALVYVRIPANTKAIHLIDQDDSNLSVGVQEESYTFTSDSTVLAFYSSCRNKPHRFQFIYSNKGYGKDADGKYVIARKDDRTIIEKDCQYYIDYDNPDSYKEPSAGTNTKDLDLYLPDGFSVVLQTGGETNDTTLSSWYRGKRYGFAQQTVYVPVLEKYCQKYRREENIPLIKDKNIYHHGTQGEVKATAEETGSNELTLSGYISTEFTATSAGAVDTIQMKKKHEYVGLRLELQHHDRDTYVLKYKLKVNHGSLVTIGGHNAYYKPISYKINGVKYNINSSNDSYVNVSGAPNSEFNVEIRYEKRTPTNSGAQTDLFLQPNRGVTTYIDCTISNLSLTMEGEYLGYVDTDFISPALLQNYINNYNFESKSGWIATASNLASSSKKPEIENVYGRMDGKFISIIDDFYDGKYTTTTAYTPFMEMTFSNSNQFVLNSGPCENRTMIGNMPANDEWVLDYKILTSSGGYATKDTFSFSIGEYEYNKTTGGYAEKTGSQISFTQSSHDYDTATGAGRVIFKVSSNTYTDKTFPENSRIYVKIKPNNNYGTPAKFYLQKLSFFRKSVDSKGNIIEPDYKADKSLSATDYLDKSVVEKQYQYFSAWLVDPSNSDAISDPKDLVPITLKTLNYLIYKPVYNNGAKKIRTISAKESNYFNILQTIAQTFEAWLKLDIYREDEDEPGKITSKKISFKNYVGENNNASFQYGVNLKEISRQKSSKNIVTKLIVKQNNNTLAEDGFCTIARAGANPTGENYIYDFQYFHNQNIMNSAEYLNNTYYLDGAIGPDAELWNDETKVKSEEGVINPKGYYARLKKINNALTPIADQIAGFTETLVEKEADFAIAKSMKEAANSGMEQVRTDFYQLTGVYPEEAQDNTIELIALSTSADRPAIVPQEEWWKVSGTPSIADKTVTVTIAASSYQSTCYADIEVDDGTTLEWTTSSERKITKKGSWTGLYLVEDWEIGREYTMEYDLKYVGGTLENIGCHHSYFNNFSLTVTDKNGKTLTSPTTGDDTAVYPGEGKEITSFVKNETYHVKVVGTYYDGKIYSNNLWIQPNRGSETEVVCEISDIKLTKTIKDSEASKDYERIAHFYLNVNATVKGHTDPVPRTFSMSCKLAAKATTATVEQKISLVDQDRSDVKKYIHEYTIYDQKLKSYTAEYDSLQPTINSLKESLKTSRNRQKQLVEYKRALNQAFYKKYSRFILEGTWISEEYVDDDKYYTDAQSVLYNSCYPQVAYNISVISLSALPGYEGFNFGLGDKTYAIDEQFFGNKLKEEVIISEKTDNLDNPSKDSIKVQNFKNQFQDLFQKITATVQQTQYNVGTYEKGAALVDASLAEKNKFITDAINGAQTYLQYGQTVNSDSSGITITDTSDKQNQLRLVGGAILFKVLNPDTQESTWMTGITKDGISASLITAGKLNVGEVQIMYADEPVFRWDAYGISAYDAYWNTSGDIKTISGINSYKFVRFDKHGVYGINNNGIDGATWHPTDNDSKSAIAQIDEKATFALTWEGLKVTGNNGVIAKIGKQSWGTDGSTVNGVIRITKNDTNIFSVDDSGNAEFSGTITASTFKNSDSTLYLSTTELDGISIGGKTRDDLLLRIGSNFAVDKNGTFYASSGEIGNMSITKLEENIIVNDNMLPYSIFQSGEGWEGMIGQDTGTNSDGTTWTRERSAVIDTTYNGHPSLHIKVTDQISSKKDDFLWNGCTKYLGSEYNHLAVGTKVTISCYCKIVSLENSRQGGITNRLGMSIKGYIDEPDTVDEKGNVLTWKQTHHHGNGFIVEQGDQKIGDENWHKLTYTYTLEKAYNKPHIYVYIAENGEAYFADFKVEIGEQATTWVAYVGDDYNKGVNLYTGEDLNLPGTGDSPNHVFADLKDRGTFTPEENKSYYLTADVRGTWASGRADAHKCISVIVYTHYTKNGVLNYYENLRSEFQIQNGKIKGRLPFARDLNNVLADRVLIYGGCADFMAGNNITISNIKIEEGTAEDNGLIRASVNNNFSWHFSPTTGVTMWNGTQGSGEISGENEDKNVVFKIFKDSISLQNVLYLKGTGIFEGGTSGITADLKDEKGKPYSVSDLVFKAGDGFGVTKDGTIYANAGRIGPVDVIKIASTDNIEEAVNNIEIGGKNLVLKSDQFKESSEYLVATYDLSEDWSLNTEYCITINGEVNKGQAFGIWANGPSTGLASLTLDTTTGLHKAVFTTPSSITVSDRIKTLRVYNCAGSSASYAKIYQIKLEKGNKATDWTPAPEDQVLAISDNENFSWKFLPNSGFYMYNGKASASDPDEVFKIYYNEAPSKLRYEAWLKGHIEAESGQIGAFAMTDTSTTNFNWKNVAATTGAYPAALYFVSNTLQTAYSEAYGSNNYGYIEIISKELKNNNLNQYYRTSMTSNAIRLQYGTGSNLSQSTLISPAVISLQEGEFSTASGLKITYDQQFISVDDDFYKNCAAIINYGSGNKSNLLLQSKNEIRLQAGNKAIDVSELYDRILTLGFKGPYSIKLGSTKIGQVYKIGTLVYGAISNAYSSEPSNSELTFYHSNGTQVYLPPTSAGQSITWLPNKGSYKAVITILSVTDSSKTNIDGTKNYTKMSITSHEPESADSLSHWTYFCFSTSSDHHPDANVGGSMSTDGSTSTDPGDNTVGVVGNGGGGGACVFSGTKISISSTEEIEVTKLRNNTHIAFCNPDTLEWSTQQKGPVFYKNSITKKVILTLEDGKTLECSEDHPILTKSGFKTLSPDYGFDVYTIEDYCATVDGYKKLADIKTIDIEPTTVYNIMAENGLIVANGIIISSEMNYSTDLIALTNAQIQKK